MQKIYQFDHNRIFTGVTLDIEDDAGAPIGWTFNAPPELSEGEFASFRGPDWVVLDSYPVQPVQPAYRNVVPSPDKPTVL